MGIAKKTALCGTLALVASAPLVLTASGTADATQPTPIACVATAIMTITPNVSGGADYSIKHGGGLCEQGPPFHGAWSIQNITGSGSATTLTCVPVAGGVVSGLKIKVGINFRNDRTGVKSFVKETWTELLPVDALNSTVMKVNPGTNAGTIVTRIFNQCPTSASPSTQLVWTDTNPA